MIVTALNAHHFPLFVLSFHFFYTFFFLSLTLFCFSQSKGIITMRGGWALWDSAKAMFSNLFILYSSTFTQFWVFWPCCSILPEHDLTLFCLLLLFGISAHHSNNDLILQILWSLIPHVGTNLTHACFLYALFFGSSFLYIFFSVSIFRMVVLSVYTFTWMLQPFIV